MGDSELVTSIVAGDPEGLAAAYDKYAADLYSYCRTLLREPADAADAVQDTFVIAAAKLAGLRDPDRLRPWLFAVARNECLHGLKSRRRQVTPLQDAPELADDSADVGAGAERAETVALVRAAVGGLNDSERDAITQLWHGLEVSEVAAVLGVSRNHAYALFSRAREQLEASVAVLLVGRAGRRDCAVLDRMLGDWDGRLNARLRRRVGRHIDQCRVCSDRRRQEVTPALLYGLTPGAILGMAALRGSSALGGAFRLGGPPARVRAAVLRLTAGPGPHAASSLTAGGRSMHSFGASGFPRPLHHGLPGLLPRHLPVAGIATTAVTAAAVVATAVVPHLKAGPNLPGGGPAASAPLPGAAAPGSAPQRGSSAAAAPAAGTPSATQRGSGPPASAASSGPTATQPSPSGGTTGPGIPPAGTPAGTQTATATATAPVTATTPVTATATAVATLSAGTLTVSPRTVLLSPLLGGSLTLTASGGPVGWTISEPESLIGKLTVSPSSGTLDAGDSATVTITVTGLVTVDAQLTAEPGDQQVTVLLGLG